MDEINDDIAIAKQKEAQAAQVRNMEAYNRDDPTVVNSLEVSARELDQEATNLRQDADDITAQQNSTEETEE